MSDMKKLFKRDWLYWVIVTAVMTLFIIYTMANINADGSYHSLFNLEDTLQQSQYLYELQAAHPELQHHGIFTYIPYEFMDEMMKSTLIMAMIAQAVRLLVQETRNRAEVLRTFPVKSRNMVTYHYLSGLLTVGIPLLIQMAILRLDMLYIEKNTSLLFENKERLWLYAGIYMITFMMFSSLLILCRKVTTDVPGTIFTFFVVLLAWLVLAVYFTERQWYALLLNSIPTLLFYAILSAVWILLSYLADQRQDYARNGIYSFTAVHWVMMATIFAIIYSIFYTTFRQSPRLAEISRGVAILVSAAISALMTAGAHFIARPKKS